MKATYQIITPMLAQTMLGRSNFRNRSLKPAVVRRYAADMIVGRWKENGESIVVDEFGAVIDGQHRLRALISCGKSFGFVVVQGVSRDAFDTLDMGKNRTSTDTLQVSGMKNASSVAAVLRLIVDYKLNGDLSFKRYQFSDKYRSFDVQSALEEHPLVVCSCDFIAANRRNALLKPRSMIAMFHYLFGEKDSDKRDDFFDRFVNNNFQGIDCPVKALIFAYQHEYTLRSMNASRVVTAAYWIKSWNAFRKGSKIKKLIFAIEHHEFPSII